jgi:hypothetical protein
MINLDCTLGTGTSTVYQSEHIHRARKSGKQFCVFINRIGTGPSCFFPLVYTFYLATPYHTFVMADEKNSYPATIDEHSSSSQDSGVTGAPPAPYDKDNTIPEDFRKAGIKEEDLVLLKEYTTIIVVDDSGSMAVTLWDQASNSFSPL